MQVTPLQSDDGTQVQIIKLPDQLEQGTVQLVEMDSQTAAAASSVSYAVRQKEPEIEPPVGNVSQNYLCGNPLC